jgi:hypothetical protein
MTNECFHPHHAPALWDKGRRLSRCAHIEQSCIEEVGLPEGLGNCWFGHIETPPGEDWHLREGRDCVFHSWAEAEAWLLGLFVADDELYGLVEVPA